MMERLSSNDSQEGDQQVVKIPEPTVRKGRRGLARKQNAASLTQNIPSTSHNASVYSSCVSRGLQNILKGIHSEEKECSEKSTDASKNIVIESKAELPTEDVCAEIIPEEVICVEADAEIEFVEENTEVAVVAGPETLRSPTPPPESESRIQYKKRRMNKKLTSALNTLNKAKGNLNLDASTPLSKSKSRSRQKKSQNPNIDFASLPVDDSPVKIEMMVKVRYLSSVYRILIKMTDSFNNLLSQLSGEIGQEQHHLSLFLNDQVLHSSKTPKEVGLTVADIIECHCIKDAKGEDFGNEPIALLIQCSNSKRKTTVNVTKRQPFKEILDMYAEQTGISASSFHFCFDGEDVSPNDTPLSLEMEDEDILDLMPVSTQKSRRSRSISNSVITII